MLRIMNNNIKNYNFDTNLACCFVFIMNNIYKLW